jgi:membrane-bound ClpP family serine protease
MTPPIAAPAWSSRSSAPQYRAHEIGVKTVAGIASAPGSTYLDVMTIAVLSARAFRTSSVRALLAIGASFLFPSVASAHGINSPLEAVGLLLGNPDLAFILLLIGIYGIILEVAHPGAILPGLIGVVCLALAAFALWILPVQYGALALLIAGIALMTAEAFTPGFGVLGLLGFAAFIGGGYFLFEAPAGSAEIRVSLPVILGAAVGSAALLFLVLGAALKARRRPTVTGSEEMLAARGTVIDWSGDVGNIRIRGEVWAARGSATFKPGDGVKVASRDGLTLVVEPEQ